MIQKNAPFTFGERSLKELATLHPDLQKICNVLITMVDFTITDGHRGEKEQNEAVAKGFSKVKFPNSKHNKTPSLACDLAPYPIDYKNPKRFIYLAGAFMAVAAMLKAQGEITSNVRYGGDWNRNADPNDESFIDLPHFEIID